MYSLEKYITYNLKAGGGDDPKPKKVQFYSDFIIVNDDRLTGIG